MVGTDAPLNGTFSVVILEGIDRLALFTPGDVGEKTAWTVQLLGGAMVWPEQLSLSLLNSEAFVPVKVMVPITRSAVPPPEIVNVCAVDELPTCTFPKS